MNPSCSTSWLANTSFPPTDTTLLPLKHLGDAEMLDVVELAHVLRQDRRLHSLATLQPSLHRPEHALSATIVGEVSDPTSETHAAITEHQIYTPPSAATLPSAYPKGVTVGGVTTSAGWPVSGTLTTTKWSNSRVCQTVVNTDSDAGDRPRLYIRYGFVTTVGTNEVWSPFLRMGRHPEHINSLDNGELVTTLPVPTSATDADRRIVFSKEITNLLPGDILQVTAEFQITNDLGYNVMCVSQIILGDTATSLTGYEITEANGRNVTPDMHHDFHTKAGSLAIPPANTRRFVNLVAYAASTAATAGATIQVDPDYGRLSIIKH